MKYQALHILAVKTKHLLSVATVVATTTVVSWSAPAQALKSYNFNWTGTDGYSVSGSFSYDDSFDSGIISKNQLNSFNISFLRNSQVEQTYSTLSSLFFFEFDTSSWSVNSLEAGAFSTEYFPNYESESVAIGSLSFLKVPSDRADEDAAGCDGLVWEKDGGTHAHATGRCDSNSSVVVVPSQPSQPVPEPQPLAGIALLGVFGTVSWLKRKNKTTCIAID